MKITKCAGKVAHGVVAAFVLAAATVGTPTAMSQASSAPPASSSPAKSAAAESGTLTSPEAPLEEVVVSGSRIRGGNFSAPTPVTTISSATLQADAVVRVSTELFNMPEMHAVQNAGSATNMGGAFINLRSLGQQRNLTLVDGARFVASQVTTNSVDVNLIPTAIVDRIDVVTAGASAAWGSDAVSGVTNFILKKNIQGVESNLQYGASSHGDDKDFNASLAWGTGFSSGRGHVELAGEVDKLWDAATFANRDWTAAGWLNLTNSKINGITYGQAAVANTRLAAAAVGGLITGATAVVNNSANNAAALALFQSRVNGALTTGTTFNAAGQMVPFGYGTNVGPTYMTGGGGTWPIINQPLADPVQRGSIYGRVDYDVSDTVRAFGDFLYGESNLPTTRYFPIWNPNSGDTPLTIRSGNPFIPADLQSIMTSNSIASIALGRIDTDIGAFANTTTIRTGRLMAGLDGELPGSWTWSGYFTHGQTRYHAQAANNLIEPNFRAAVDVTTNAQGQPICRINSTSAADIAATSLASYPGFGAAAGCVPLNPFGPGAVTPAMAAYVTGTQSQLADFGQDVFEASAQGSPFRTWAGEVRTVVGAGYRRDSLFQVTDGVSQLTTTTYPGGGYQFGNPKPINDPDGGGARALGVREEFGEIEVPVAQDLPFVHAAGINAAARLTDYSTSGNVTTWKYGATYEPTEDILFRATASRDIRAANLSELYTGTQLSGGQVTDYDPRVTTAANGTQYVVLTITQGNPLLKPEVSHSQTIGFTVHPRAIPQLNVSVDYYKLNLVNEIATLGAQNVINTCYGKQNAPLNTAVCSLITRDPATNLITSISNTNLNIAGTRTEGIDFQAAYRFSLRGGSSLKFVVNGAYIENFIVNNGLTITDFAGAVSSPNGMPKYRADASAGYDSGPLSLLLTGRYFGSAKYSNTLNQNGVTTDIYNNNVPSRTYLDASIQYKVGRGNVYLHATNVFDLDPPIVPGNQLSPPTSAIYDQFGRTISVGYRLEF